MVRIELMEQIDGGIMPALTEIGRRQINQAGNLGFEHAGTLGGVLGGKGDFKEARIRFRFMRFCERLCRVQGNRTAVPAAGTEGEIIEAADDKGIVCLAKKGGIDRESGVIGPGTLSV